MGIDVTDVLARYEDAPVAERMREHSRDEVRRQPSADQKKVRRLMTTQKQAAEAAEDQRSIPELLALASKAATYAEQQELMTKVEQRKTAAALVRDAEHNLDLTLRESVTITPRGTHELHTAATEWLMDPGLTVTASSSQDATHELVAQASLWFNRVSDFVKEDHTEFSIQAQGAARKTASSFGDHAEAAAQAFLAEAERLYRQGQKTGSIKTAMEVHNLDEGGMVEHPDPEMGKVPVSQENPPEARPAPHHEPQPGPHQDASIPDANPFRARTPGLQGEVNHLLSGNDVNGVRQMAEGWAAQQVHGRIEKAAHLRVVRDDEDSSLAAALAGYDPGEHTAASTLPQADVNSGFMTTDFPSLGGVPSGQDTSSSRAPALEEIQNFTGWDGTSVVPPNAGEAEAANGGGPLADATAGGNHGFPVSGGLAHTASKENGMTQQFAACPSCSGTGHVAVRQVQAYSGLPQVDQIVNADETPGTQPAPGQSENYPTQVAFPLVGWGQNPQQGAQNVNNAIQQTEQQLGERASRSPLLSQGSYHQANGRDNSGWIGDMGARGTDYPGDSTPVGYDGSTNLGSPSPNAPAYGYGGDNGNQPLKPYGADEADDYTNNPGQNWQPGQDTHADQAWRTVSPGMTTQGSQDPFIATAQAEIARYQREIAQRTAMLRRAQQAG